MGEKEKVGSGEKLILSISNVLHKHQFSFNLRPDKGKVLTAEYG